MCNVLFTMVTVEFVLQALAVNFTQHNRMSQIAVCLCGSSQNQSSYRNHSRFGPI